MLGLEASGRLRPDTWKTCSPRGNKFKLFIAERFFIFLIYPSVPFMTYGMTLRVSVTQRKNFLGPSK